MTRKLIEVALPLEEISKASRRDKDRKTGTIKNVHKWFAPMPTPAWRALLFASVVDDPGNDEERTELLELVKQLVGEEGQLPSQAVLDRAKKLMEEAGPLPTVLDPFCGGGSTIVEAQRLGLPAIGSDLNPVPVLITKVLCELIPAVTGRPSLVASDRIEGTGGPLDGFIADLRYYAERVRQAAWDQVGYLYPQVPNGVVTAWLWARTVTCPNPACGATIPLYSSPWLSKRKGQERWLRPVVEGRTVRFEIGTGKTQPPQATKIGRGAKFRCLVCGETASEAAVKREATRVGLGQQLLLTVVDTVGNDREYRAVDEAPDLLTSLKAPVDSPDFELPNYARWFSSPAFGLTTQADLYTTRQLHMMGAFADAVARAPQWIQEDGGDADYVKAITGVLGLCVGKLAMANSTQARWYVGGDNGTPRVQAAFGRHALPMIWDYVELNPFSDRAANWNGMLDSVIGGLRRLGHGKVPAQVTQVDARIAGEQTERSAALVATDPPYFGQIGYADLSDYFYVWHRRALRNVVPYLYGTISTPKDAELIAAPYRHDGHVDEAYMYYVNGFTETFHRLAAAQRPDAPMVVIYAHRQDESDGQDGMTSSAWDALLEAMLAAGVGVVGTWPIHATSSSRQIGQGTNALASYMAMVCRPRPDSAGITDRPGFVRALRTELPASLMTLQAASTLPFDLTQAALGPGLAIFSRFARVVEPSGEAMRVKTAIGLINQVRSEILSEQDDEFDAETRWAIQWFERYGFDAGPFGEAEKLFTAMATSLDGLRRTGIVETKAPNVWLLEPKSMPATWDPVSDPTTCTWEVTMQLLRALHVGRGEEEAAALLGRVGHFGDLAHDLAYRIADVCEVMKRTSTALLVNGLIASWPELTRRAATGTGTEERLF